MGVESGKTFRLVFAPLIEGHVPRRSRTGPQQDARAPDGAANSGVHFRGTTRYDI